MQFFKTVEGMLSHQFEQDGERDDKGQPIKATEQPMSAEEYAEWKMNQPYKGKTLMQHLSGESGCCCDTDLVCAIHDKYISEQS